MKILMIFVLCSVAFAQDAVVIELSKTDAMTAKTLYDAKVAADHAWELFNGKLKETYKNSYAGISFYNGIDFSKDFRFIVPKTGGTVPFSQWNGCSNQWSGSSGCITTAPLIYDGTTQGVFTH